MRAPTAAVREWWPVLAIAALALLSVEMLRSSYDRWEDVLQRSVAAIDNLAESRRRLMRAYLVDQRRSAGDETFVRGSALAEATAAENALRNWISGRSAILGVNAEAPAESALVALSGAYQEGLSRFRDALAADGGDLVALRRSFSAAEGAASALEAAVHERLRETIQREQRSYRLRLAGWGLLLLTAALGLAFTRRARVTAEEERTRSESRLSRLRAVAPVGIIECDEAGRIQAANVMWCSLTGRSESDWIGRTWWDAFDGNDRERARQLWHALVELGSENTAELRVRPPGDEEGRTWVLARTARGTAGPDTATDAPTRCVLTLTDITQRRQIEEQLHHAQKMEAVGRLAGGVAHDFNNLLTSIGGFATLAREAVPEREPVHDDLLEIERGVDRGRALTRQLLTFSRQDRIQPDQIDLRNVVLDLERMLRRLVREDIEIKIVVAEQPAPVLADQGQLEQVVTNLVVNASDAMPDGGRIRIAVGPIEVQQAFPGAMSEIDSGRYALLSISDTGTGIPPVVQERIFEPFYTSKERGRGTGLGLSTVWAIVRQGGGHIHVYSEQGRGSVFKIYIPESTVGDATAPRPTPVAPADGEAPAGTALVVEDEEAVRRLTKRVLQLRGWDVLEAGEGAEALRVIDGHEGPINVLITDMIMRGMGGIELAEQVRARGRHIPTLFVSGYAETDLDLDDAHFLEKPFAPDALVRAVTQVLNAERDR